MQVIETNLQFRGNLTKRNATVYIVLHHAAASKCTIYDVHRWHLQREWLGCGYHYFCDKKGLVYQGRPRDVIGAHALGYNHCSVGICAEGHYEQEQMPNEQKYAIANLLIELKKIYPQAKIVAHKDLNPTKCPGKYFPMEEILAIVTSPVARFKDVQNHWARTSIERIAQLGLLGPCGENVFEPDRPVTRAEFAVALDRLLELLKNLGR